ncbi:MAG: 16S rRNA (adenine(1518)-N(6)/adenine(1519)-N(6))-dimethyltransferase RsmA [Treponema sp.]
MMIQHPDYNASAALSALLNECGFGMQKKFGQNFLINEHIRRELISALAPAKTEHIWEVGPGLGAMTVLLLETGAALTAFEIDRGFAQLLTGYFGKLPNFKLIQGDVLKTWHAEYKQHRPDCFFGNLPYNIAAKIIADTIEAECFFNRMAITVQKEVGMRMTAQPGSADYSSFSVLCQWQYEIKPIRDIASAAFWPKPNVESRAVLFTRKKDTLPVKDSRLFLQLVRSLFAARRKTLKNNLTVFLTATGIRAASAGAEALLHEAHIPVQARAETLSVYDFIRLSDILSNYNECI